MWLIDWLEDLLGLRRPTVLWMSGQLTGAQGGPDRPSNDQPPEEIAKEFDQYLDEAEKALLKAERLPERRNPRSSRNSAFSNSVAFPVNNRVNSRDLELAEKALEKADQLIKKLPKRFQTEARLAKKTKLKKQLSRLKTKR